MLYGGGYTGPFPAFTFTRVTGLSSGVVVLAGRCLLHAVVVGRHGAGNNTFRVFNAASVAAAGNAVRVATIDTVGLGGTFLFDCLLPDGLVYKSIGGTGADVTLVYAGL
jgi:hypothetical protein